MSQRYLGGIVTASPTAPTTTSASGEWTITQQLQYNSTWPKSSTSQITRSLRFRSSASAYLNRTFGTPTNNKKWTWSAWVKRGILGANETLFSANSSQSNYFDFRFNTSDQIYVQNRVGASNLLVANTTAVYRDPSAWYHIVFAFDSANPTAANRNLLYVNGVNVSLSANSSLNDASSFNVSGYEHDIGGSQTLPGLWATLDGYLTEINFIDGQALDPSYFGYTDSNGIWQASAYTGTYGTNGFYLPFTDTTSTTTLCYDKSGNGNNWTPNNISVTAGTTYDSMVDSPTVSATASNYCVLNPLYGTGITGNFYLDSANLNLNVNNNSAYRNLAATFSPEGFKGYFEITATTAPNFQVGFAYESISPSSSQYTSAGSFFLTDAGDVRNGATTIKSSCTPAFSSGDVIQVAFDFTGGARNVWFGRNGTWGSNSVGVGVPSTGTNPVLTISNIAQSSRFYFAMNSGAGTVTIAANFGQQPWTYTPPTGFVALNTYNLPTSTITNGAAYMAATTFNGVTGGGSVVNTVNGVYFQPDMVWMKSRNAVHNHEIGDSVRGTAYGLFPNLTNAEVSDTRVSAFNSNGFSFGTNSNSAVTGETEVGWQWKAGGAGGSSNTNGSITSTVSAGATQGFSVVTYTGIGSAATVGHGLGVAPSMIIAKSRNNAVNWITYHVSTGNSGYMNLNTTNASSSLANYWGTSVNSSTFGFLSNAYDNANGNMVAYCFAPVAGYSAFGSYTGNGSTDGPFVYTGFRPRFIMIKGSSFASNWFIEDSSRNGYNVNSGVALRPNLSSAEDGTTTYDLDILSNGFKLRSSAADSNTSGATFIWAAFAENPFNISRAR